MARSAFGSGWSSPNEAPSPVGEPYPNAANDWQDALNAADIGTYHDPDLWDYIPGEGWVRKTAPVAVPSEQAFGVQGGRPVLQPTMSSAEPAKVYTFDPAIGGYRAKEVYGPPVPPHPTGEMRWPLPDELKREAQLQAMLNKYGVIRPPETTPLDALLALSAERAPAPNDYGILTGAFETATNRPQSVIQRGTLAAGAPPALAQTLGALPFFLGLPVEKAALAVAGQVGGSELGRKLGIPDIPVVGNPLGLAGMVAAPGAAGLAARGARVAGPALVRGVERGAPGVQAAAETAGLGRIGPAAVEAADRPRMYEGPPEGGTRPAGVDYALSVAEKQVRPSTVIVGKPRQIVVAQTARVGTVAEEYSRFRDAEIGAEREARQAWQAAPARYIGPPGRPNAGGLTDYLEAPGLYTDVSPHLEAAKGQWGRAFDGDRAYTEQHYGVNIRPYKPPDPNGVYVPHMQTQEVQEALSVGGSGGSTARAAIQKERAYPTISDRMANDKFFKPELNTARLADAHARQLASMAATEVYKAGVGGLDRLGVMREVHPELAARMEGLRAKLASLQGSLGRVDARVNDGIQAFLHSPMEPDDLAGLADTLNTTVKANAVGKTGPNFGKTAGQLRSELGAAKQDVAKLQPFWRTAGTGDYVRDPISNRYMDVQSARASKDISQTNFDNSLADGILSSLEEIRISNLGAGDFSPLTFAQGLLGAASHPDVLVRNAGKLAKAAFVSDEAVWAATDPQMRGLYERIHGYSVTQGAPEIRQPGRGAERIPVAGKGVRALNEGMNRIVQFGRFKAWEADVGLLRAPTPAMSLEEAGVKAAQGLSSVVPQLNLTPSGFSRLSQRMMGAPFNSISFTVAGPRLLRDYTAGMAQLLKATASGKVGVEAWQSIAGDQQIALLRGTLMLGTISAMAAASAAVAGDPRKSRGERMIDAINPRSSQWWNIQIGEIGGKQRSIPIGGPFRSFGRAAAQVAGGGPAGRIGAGVQYGRGRLQTAIGTPYDLIANRDWKGRKIRDGSQLDQVKDVLLYGLQNVNIVAGAPIEAARTGGGTSATELGLNLATQFGGFNLRDETIASQRDRTRDEVAQEQFGSTYRDLAQANRNKIDADLRVSGLVQQAREKAAKGGSVIAQATLAQQDDRAHFSDLARGVDVQLAAKSVSGPVARQTFDDYEKQIVIAAETRRNSPEYKAAIASIDKGTLTPAEQAQEDYFAIFDQTGVKNSDGSLNFNAYDKALTAWEQKWPSFSKEDVSPSKPLSPAHAELKQARRDLEPYFDAADKGFALAQKLAGKTPEGSDQRIILRYDSLDAFETAMRTTLRRAGTDEDKIPSRLAKIEDSLGLANLMDAYQRMVITKQPRLILPLQKWYGASDELTQVALDAAKVGAR